MQHLHDNGDGTITDLNTGLMWQKADSQVERPFSSALRYSKDLHLAGYEDWRMPTPLELQSIFCELQVPSQKCQFFTGNSPWIWTSLQDNEFPDVAIGFNYKHGDMHKFIKEYFHLLVRCVRTTSK